jgi:hypothetical protein
MPGCIHGLAHEYTLVHALCLHVEILRTQQARVFGMMQAPLLRVHITHGARPGLSWANFRVAREHVTDSRSPSLRAHVRVQALKKLAMKRHAA